MTTQQKINTAILVVLAALVLAFVFEGVADRRREERVMAAVIRSQKAIAVDSANRARLRPLLDSLTAKVKAIESSQQSIKTSIIFNARRNENLNKQLDSVNAVLGLRPDF